MATPPPSPTASEVEMAEIADQVASQERELPSQSSLLAADELLFSEPDEDDTSTVALTQPSVSAAEPAAGEENDAGDIGAQPDKGLFHVNAKRFHLTYKSHLPFAALHTFLCSLNKKSKKMIAWSLVHEVGDSQAGYPHTHALINYAEKLQTKNAALFDYMGIHPHIKVVKTAAHFANIVKYHQKAPIGLVDSHGCDDVTDCQFARFTKLAKKHKTRKELLLDPDGMPVFAKYKNWAEDIYQATRPEAEDDYKVEKAQDWQLTMEEFFNIDWSNDEHKCRLSAEGPVKSWKDWASRFIVWVWSQKGGTGKSTYARHIAIKHRLLLSGPGSFHNLAHVFAKGDFTGLVFDLPRSVKPDSAEFKQVCLSIEQFKNGSFTDLKYQGEQVHISRSSPIFVFANFACPLDNEYFSDDRLENTMFELSSDDGKCEKLDLFIGYALMDPNTV